VDMDEVGEVKGGVFEKLVKTFPSENRILVFPTGQTGSLEQRAIDLRLMTEQEKQRMKNGRQMQLRLIEELKKSEKMVEELKLRAKKDMVMKFGREVDLDKVVAAIINLELLDKEIQLDKLRRYHYIERQKMSDSILDALDERTAEIRENSNLKILKAMVLERHRDLDYFVWISEQDEEKREKRDETRKQNEASIRASSAMAVPRAIARGASSFVDPGEHGTVIATSQITIHMEVEAEINDLKSKVQEYEMRARELRNALCICRRKVGLPPILPLDSRALQYEPTTH